MTKVYKDYDRRDVVVFNPTKVRESSQLRHHHHHHHYHHHAAAAAAAAATEVIDSSDGRMYMSLCFHLYYRRIKNMSVAIPTSTRAVSMKP